MGPLDYRIGLLSQDRLDIRHETVLSGAGIDLRHLGQHLGIDALGEVTHQRILVHAGDMIRLAVDGAIDDRRRPDDRHHPLRRLFEGDRLAAVIEKRTLGMQRCRQEKRQGHCQGRSLVAAGHGPLL